MSQQQKRVGLMFGLNYENLPKAYRLNGCINDVKDMQALLRTTGICNEISVFTSPQDTRRDAILQQLTQLSQRTNVEDIGLVWIHYSGHGSSVQDGRSGGDELDGKDECLVPSDFLTAGTILDDHLRRILDMFSANCKVIATIDACHSGTMGDLQYMWSIPALPGRPISSSIQNTTKCDADIVMISGCSDPQTSADAWMNQRFQGAFTAALMDALRGYLLRPASLRGGIPLFALVQQVRSFLARKGFSQVPQLTSSRALTAASGINLPASFAIPRLVLQPVSTRASLSTPAWRRILQQASVAARCVLPFS
jgi:hypothetical protein